nr:MAG TPA: hypothetical protein [Caudoviricetes sp.]
MSCICILLSIIFYLLRFFPYDIIYLYGKGVKL